MPALVLAEVDYFLRADRLAMASLVEDVLDPRSRYQFEPTSPADVSRAMALDAKFADLDLGLVDGVVAAVAERLSISRVLTIDSCRLQSTQGGPTLFESPGDRPVNSRLGLIDEAPMSRWPGRLGPGTCSGGATGTTARGTRHGPSCPRAATSSARA